MENETDLRPADPGHGPHADCAVRVELPEVLSPGGAIEGALLRSLGCDEAAATAEIRRHISADLNTLCTAWLSAAHTREQRPWADPRGPLAEVLGEHPYRQNALLGYLVARLCGYTYIAQMLHQSAAHTYAGAPDRYDPVLGELLPAEFRTSVRAWLDRRNYSTGTNPTQAEDWSVYRQRRETRRRAGPLGLATGFPTLDRARFALQGITFLAAPTGCAKTSLSLYQARQTILGTDDYAVLYYLLDVSMSKDDLLTVAESRKLLPLTMGHGNGTVRST
jgi:hypothetical protein